MHTSVTHTFNSLTRPTGRSRTLTVLASLALLPLALAGCATTTGVSSEASNASSSDATTQGELAFESPWAKAASGMSGVFGTLINGTDSDVTLVEASSPRAGLVELHETAMVDGQMVMRELEGGFEIPAGGSFELNPGEDHIMLMELDSELLPGEVLPITLTFSNGESLTLDLDVREYAGADESYGDLEHHDHDHEHGGDHNGDHGHEGHDD